jgi:ribonuclease D
MQKKNPYKPVNNFGMQSQRQEKIETRNLRNCEDNIVAVKDLSRNKLTQSNSKVSVGLYTPKKA